MIDLLVVDDHALIRKGLKQMLEESPDIRVKGEAETGNQALRMLQEQQFDVVLLDISLADRHGMEVLSQIRQDRPEVKVIILSMHPEEQYGMRALKAGASGYINKQSATESLVKAIHQVSSGKRYISESLAEQLVNNLTRDSKVEPHHTLSNREYQTLCLMASGKSLTEISEIMMLSPKTVSVYRARMLEKMNFKNNAEAVHYAIKHHLIDSEN